MSDREYEPGELVVTEDVSLQLGSLALVRREWSYIPLGKFPVDSPHSSKETNGEKSQHQVKPTRGFLMQRTPVTQAQWLAVMGTGPSRFKGGRRPVENVSWFDAVEYCNALSRLAGLPEAYSNEGGRMRAVADSVGYRLPTETEWIVACRAVSAPRDECLDDIAWYSNNSRRESHEVGLKRPNAWNLYDMLGNVWEWTQEMDDYTLDDQTDEQGLAAGYYPDDSDRVFCGGSWSDGALYIRAGGRYSRDPNHSDSNVGFRPMRLLP